MSEQETSKSSPSKMPSNVLLKFSDTTKLYLCTLPTDMRKAITGLSLIVVETLSKNPQCGDVFIFYNKNCNKVKLLYWDKNGFSMIYKRLEKGRFKIPAKTEGNDIEISDIDIQWLLAGFDFNLLKQHPELYFSNYF